MKRLSSRFLLLILGWSSLAFAELPQKLLPDQGNNVVALDTRPLPKLREQPDVIRLPMETLTDAFGLPVFVAVDDEASKQQEDILAGGEIGRIINKLNIQGILPGQEVLIETFVVPMGGSFAVKVKDNEVMLLHVQEISNRFIIFGWAKDDSIYRYRIPKRTEEDPYLDEENKDSEDQAS
ncbi:MAG: hypothetical protein ACOY3I_02165 [Verrucomicrobiota bacterium]